MKSLVGTPSVLYSDVDCFPVGLSVVKDVVTYSVEILPVEGAAVEIMSIVLDSIDDALSVISNVESTSDIDGAEVMSLIIAFVDSSVVEPSSVFDCDVEGSAVVWEDD